jgi:hypothetical protein
MKILRANTLRASSRRTPGPITPGFNCCRRHLPQRQNETARRMGPGVRRDDVLRLVAHQNKPSSSGLTGRSSTPRRRCDGVSAVRTFPESSRRTPGPIAPGFNCCIRHLPQRQNETTRRMGPGVRRDDELRLVTLQTKPSSSGLTGRSSTPRLLDPISGAPEYLHPSPLRGGVGGGGSHAHRRLCRPPSPTLPRKGGGSGARRWPC